MRDCAQCAHGEGLVVEEPVPRHEPHVLSVGHVDPRPGRSENTGRAAIASTDGEFVRTPSGINLKRSAPLRLVVDTV